MTEEMDDYTTPFSMRLTRAQRRKLGEDAAPLPVGEYVRSRLFDNPTPLKRTSRRPVQDEVFAVRRCRISDRLQPGLDRYRGDNDGNQRRGLRLDGITRGGMDGFIAVVVRVGRGYRADVADEHEHAREE